MAASFEIERLPQSEVDVLLDASDIVTALHARQVNKANMGGLVVLTVLVILVAVVRMMPASPPKDLADVAALTSQAENETVQCRDFARWDGASWTDGELYTCAAYCGCNWCQSDSYQTVRAGDEMPEYVPGKLGSELFTTNGKLGPQGNMKNAPQYPFDKKKDTFSMVQHWAAGYPWYTATSYQVNAANVLRAFNITPSALDGLELGPLEKQTGELKKDCMKAGDLVGRTTFLQNTFNQACASYPRPLFEKTQKYQACKRAKRRGEVKTCKPHLNGLTDEGKYIVKTGTPCVEKDNKIVYDSRRTANYKCYVSWNTYLTAGANIQGAFNGIMLRFNLPADVACCCCGGGTKSNKPGDKMLFKIPTNQWPVGLLLSKKTNPEELKEVKQKLDGSPIIPYTNDMIDTLKQVYDEAGNLRPLKEERWSEGAPYQFRDVTYSPDQLISYPYNPGGQDCEDYQLGRDVTNSSLVFGDFPLDWVDYAGYTCKFYYYNKACNIDGSQSPEQANMFGPLTLYFNGVIKQESAKYWKTPLNNITPIDYNRIPADALKVCCQCGGGKKKDNAAPKILADPFELSYYMI